MQKESATRETMPQMRLPTVAISRHDFHGVTRASGGNMQQ